MRTTITTTSNAVRIFHVFALVHHIIAMTYSYINSQGFNASHIKDERILDVKKFAHVFFTGWNMIAHLVYFTLAVVTDIPYISSTHSKFQERLTVWKANIFYSYVFPMTLYVTPVFWTIYAIDRELIFPEVLDDFVPSWLNHSVHTNVIVFVIVDICIVNQLVPKKPKVVRSLAFVAVYHITLFHAYFASGRWAYGIYAYLSWPWKIIFTLFNHFWFVVAVEIGFLVENFKRKLSVNVELKDR